MSSCELSETSPVQSPLFQLLPAEATGISFKNTLEYTQELNPYTYRNFYNGGGVAIGDVNNDGLQDIYFTGNLVDNKLYINKGNWTFEDITEHAGVACPGVWSTGVSMVDINADGWLDIYVCKAGPPGGERRHNELFINQKDGTFTEESAKYGLNIEGLSIHAAFFDYDRDGDLDCYLLNNSLRSIGAFDLIEDQRLIPDPDGNKLLRNDDGTFTNVTSDAGLYSSKIGFGLGITISDFNRDTWPDLFISNDFFEKDYLYLNQQDGTFKEESDSLMFSQSMGSMGADATDLDNDLWPDIVVTEMLPRSLERRKTKAVYETWTKYEATNKKGYHHQFPRNVLQRNMNGKAFFEIGRQAGIAGTEWSWAALSQDFDNDGLKDIFISNGIYKDLLDRDYLTYMANDAVVRSMLQEEDAIKKMIDIMPSEAVPNAMFKNLGDFQFKEVNKDWGLATPSYSNGSAYGDLDNDGDLDLIVNNANMAPFIYQNEQQGADNYIRLRLVGDDKNTKAIGATVVIEAGDEKQVLENYPFRGFQSTVSSDLHFGLGKNWVLESVQVTWPDGAITNHPNLAINELSVISQKDGELIGHLEPYISSPNSFTHSLLHEHAENKFNQFNNERMLFSMHDNLGPGLAIEKNSHDEKLLFIGGAKNQVSKITTYNTQTNKIVREQELVRYTKPEVTCADFFDYDGDGDLDLYMGHGGRAFSQYASELHDIILLNEDGKFTSQVTLPFLAPASTSCVAIADYDQDGQEDIFVGVGYDVTTYGQPVSSYLFEVQDGVYQLSSSNDLFQEIGMVRDAAWADINNDGWLDLIVVGEWMGVNIFVNEEGQLVKSGNNYNLKKTIGLWHSLEVADIDNDGDLDLIVGNEGKNHLLPTALSLYIEDFDNNGKKEQIFVQTINGEKYPIHDLDEIISQMPSIRKHVSMYKNYATSTLDELLDAEKLKKSFKVELDMLESGIFLNNGGSFEFMPFPSEIQYSPIYASLTQESSDNTSATRLILGGNQYKYKPQYGRQDASTGWILEVVKENNGISFLKPKPIGINGQIREILPLGEKKILIGVNNKGTYIINIEPNE